MIDMKYDFIFCAKISLVLMLIQILTVVTKYIKTKIKINRELKKTKLSGEIAIIALKYIELNSENKYRNYVSIRKYMTQVEYIASNCLFDLDGLKFISKNDVKRQKSCKKLTSKIVKEMSEAPQEIVGLLTEFNDVMGKIYELQHPYKYRFAEFRRKIKNFALMLLLRICESLLNMTHKREYVENISEHSKKEINSIYDITVDKNAMSRKVA